MNTFSCNNDKAYLMYFEESLGDIDKILDHVNDNRLHLESNDDDEGDIAEGQQAELGSDFEEFQLVANENK